MASHLDYANSLFRIKQKTRNYFEEISMNTVSCTGHVTL